MYFLKLFTFFFIFCTQVYAKPEERPFVSDVSIQSTINPRLTINGVHYAPKVSDVDGPVEAPIVLFHGLASTSYHFKDLGRALSGHGENLGDQAREELKASFEARKVELLETLSIIKNRPHPISDSDQTKIVEIENEIKKLEKKIKGVNGRHVYLFNFRGHGKGGHLSDVKNPVAGDYSIRNMITEDVATAVDYVYNKHKVPIILGGHSTGAMITNLYMKGITLDHQNKVTVPQFPHGTPFEKQTHESVTKKSKGKTLTLPSLIHDPKELADRQKKVAGLVLMGGPTSFESASPVLQVAAQGVLKAKEFLPKKFDGKIGLDISPTAPDPTGVAYAVRKKLWSLVDPWAFSALPNGVVKAKNLKTHEVAGIREKGVSAPDLDLILDFAHWESTRVFEDPYTGFSYQKQIEGSSVPILNILGDEDQLAVKQDILKSMHQRPRGANIRSVVLKKTSHVDLIIGDHAVENVFPLIEKFIYAPDFVGYSGQTIDIPTCKRKEVDGIISFFMFRLESLKIKSKGQTP